MRNYITNLVLLLVCLCISGCFAPATNPFADVDKLGTVLEPNKNITIQSSIGPVTIEYVSPTKRRIVLNGESREFSLSKSIAYMGIFTETKFKQGPIDNIYGVYYEERTVTLRSEIELKKYLQNTSKRAGFEHHVNDELVVISRVQDQIYGLFTKGKQINIGIYKYEISDPKENKPPRWHYLFVTEITSR